MFEPRSLFEHPILQYIPLTVEEQQRAATPWRPGVRLSWLPGPAALNEAADRLGWPPLAWPVQGRRILLLVEGGLAAEAYYREHEAILIGEKRTGLAQLFALASHRLYRPTVRLTLYDRGGHPLASARWTQEAGPAIAKETGELRLEKGAGA